MVKQSSYFTALNDEQKPKDLFGHGTHYSVFCAGIHSPKVTGRSILMIDYSGEIFSAPKMVGLRVK
ncbi:MAG: hypothetical protein JJ879_04120 [Sneathiella sp.]|nr:hypothetical protein [Sneathiella sp.]